MEVLLFVFMTVFSDAPPVLTGLNTRAQCEIMRSSMEPEVKRMGRNATVTPCFPVLVKRAPQA